MEEERPNINLDSELLQPMKKELEKTIDRMLKVVANLDKEAEISLKIELSKEKNSTLTKSILNPRYSPVVKYTIKEKVKEYKYKNENTLGFEFEISSSEEGFIVEKVVKQENLFDEEEEEEEEEDEEEFEVIDEYEEDEDKEEEDEKEEGEEE